MGTLSTSMLARMCEKIVVKNNNAHLRGENNCTYVLLHMPIMYSCFSKTRGPIDNLISQNATYEYEVETRIGR